MALTVADMYSSRHKGTVDALKSADYPTTGDWKKVVDDARLAVVADGFNVNKYPVCVTIRAEVKKALKSGTKQAATMLDAAGVAIPNSGTGLISSAAAKRVAALEVLRRLWLIKKAGNHKIWILSLPAGYKDWPEPALDGKTYDAFSTLVNDETSHFTASDRKHLSQATQEGLKWVHRAMIVSGDPDKAKHKAILQRWFSDGTTSDDDIKAAASTLNAGLKKISKVMKSTFLLFTDMPKDRDNPDEANTNAYVFSDEKISVIYVEPMFFSKLDMWKGLKNWTRIVVHELSHREGKTDDNRYRHHAKGLKPDSGDANFTAAKALQNADSWAMFSMDSAGHCTKSDYVKVQVN